MASSVKRAKPAPSPSLWIRVSGWVCVALMLWVGLAQATHHHGDWRLARDHGQAVSASLDQGLGSQDCPLCALAHAAMPALVYSLVLGFLCTFIEVRLPYAFVPQRWHFVLFGRPPPPAAI